MTLTQTNPRSAAQILSLSCAVFSAGLTGGCAAPNKEKPTTIPASLAPQDPLVEQILKEFKVIELQLEFINTLHEKYKLFIPAALLINPSYAEPYELARAELRLITAETQKAKQALEALTPEQIAVTNRETLEKIETWAIVTASSLFKLTDAAYSYENYGRLPRGWRAPDRFEFLAVLEKGGSQR